MSSKKCVPGQSELCFCTNGLPGAQACQEDGRAFDACICDGLPVEDVVQDSDAADTDEPPTDTDEPVTDVDEPKDTQPENDVDEPKDTQPEEDTSSPGEDIIESDSEPTADSSEVSLDLNEKDEGKPGVLDCSGLSVCEGFEESEAGGPPDPINWQVGAKNCSGDGKIVVDDMVAHTGKQSIRVTSTGGYCNHVFATPNTPVSSKGKPLYVRFYVRFETAFGGQHTTFLALTDQSQNKDLRMGGQNEILMWNREQDDATLPSLSPKGMAMSVKPPAQQWICVEFMVGDGDAGPKQLSTWVDGALVEGLVVDDEPTPDVDQQWLNMNWQPDLVDVRFGWESYGQVPMTVWYDDIAVSDSPIGCMD